jgi:hypothetical protein
MGRERVEAARDVTNPGVEWSGPADELRSRFLGGVNRIAAQAQRGAQRVKGAAKDLRSGAVLQHAIAAHERGNLEAAFWLLNEEFRHSPDDPAVALHYWDVAVGLGRVDIASAAGVNLIEGRAAAGEPELAAQYWLELIKEAPDVLVSPTAIATMLPALKLRLRQASVEGPDDRDSLRGYLRLAVRHAVDPRNEGLHPGVALRIFEEGRELNPEAARRAAEAALESPNLHEKKRQRLSNWLAGLALDAPESAQERAPKPPEPENLEAPAGSCQPANGSDEDISGLAGSHPEEIGGPESANQPDAPGLAAETPPEAAEEVPESASTTAPVVVPGTLLSLDDEGMAIQGIDGDRLAYADIQAVAVAEIMGLQERPVTVIDLISNWTRRGDERLAIVRLRVADLDLETLVTRKHALGSDFAAFMGDIMERTRAIPLPDPESALGTRITCFQSHELYQQVGLRVAREGADHH